MSGLVLEVALSNESMPQFIDVDLPRYFAAGTGMRCRIGIKVFKDSRNNPLSTVGGQGGHNGIYRMACL